MRNSLTTPFEWNSTCQIRMMDAMGTIIGLKKQVRNWLLPGMRASSIRASSIDSTTASGTARPVNTAVFFAAVRNAALSKTAI